jgi:hypothetical protein
VARVRAIEQLQRRIAEAWLEGQRKAYRTEKGLQLQSTLCRAGGPRRRSARETEEKDRPMAAHLKCLKCGLWQVIFSIKIFGGTLRVGMGEDQDGWAIQTMQQLFPLLTLPGAGYSLGLVHGRLET